MNLICFQRIRITTKKFSVKKKNLPAVLLITTNYKQYFSYLFECLARESNLHKFLIFSDLNPLTPKATCIDTFGLYLFSRGALNIIFHSGQVGYCGWRKKKPCLLLPSYIFIVLFAIIFYIAYAYFVKGSNWQIYHFDHPCFCKSNHLVSLYPFLIKTIE